MTSQVSTSSVVSNEVLMVGIINHCQELDCGKMGAPGGMQYHSLEINDI
jgi:hypothetical protein